jgi:hypothetical protein
MKAKKLTPGFKTQRQSAESKEVVKPSGHIRKVFSFIAFGAFKKSF